MGAVIEDKSVVFPTDFLKGKQIEFMIISTINKLIGATGVSELTDDSLYTLFVYQIRQGEDMNYYPINEIGAFAFEDKDQLMEFVEYIPSLSAIDLLLLMNSEPSPPN